MTPCVRILLIEDNSADVRLMRELLSEARNVQYDLVDCSRLSEGLIRIAEAQFDVVLLDLDLPDSFGLDTFSRVAAAVSDLPVIVLSGNQDEGIALTAVKMGAQDYVIKGFDGAHILPRIISYAIERKKSELALQHLSAHIAQAREEERTRIAREIHDELGGALAAIKFDLSLPRRGEEHNATLQRNRGTIELIDAAIISLRRIMNNLRPSILDTLGLWAAIEWQANEFTERTGINCRFYSETEEQEPDSETATALFRIVQEALTNVAKHSSASIVNIFADIDQKNGLIRICDNGRGIREEELLCKRSFGILGMHERARSFKGRLRIIPLTPSGTEVSVTFPFVPFQLITH